MISKPGMTIVFFICTFLCAYYIVFNVSCNSKGGTKIDKDPLRHMCLIKGADRKIDTLKELVGDKYYLWNKKIVNVYFWDDDGRIADKVIRIASEWNPYSGIRFRKTDDRMESDIRVSFRTDGWWSYIGSYSTQIGKDSITLSLDSVYLYENADRMRNVILHEFGHALGLIHEHQHPGLIIPWKTKELFAYYWHNYNVDSNWVREQVINKFKSATGIYCIPDVQSIMIYAIPPGVTDNNAYVVDWPQKLSELDKKNIKNIYERKKCDD